MTDLTDRTVLITGASRGIGYETARVLGEAGCNVIAHYGGYREGAVDATAGIPEDRKMIVQADLATPGAAAELWNEAVVWRGRVDVVVNNAAIMPEVGIEDAEADWEGALAAAFAINVMAPAVLIRLAALHFIANGGGVLITMSSWAANRGSGNPKLAAYAASKAALAAVTKTMARAHARDGVLGYCIAPGTVRTDMSVRSARNQGGEDAVTASLTMGEWVPPREVADLVAFLASGTRRHLSGATLDINGASYIR